MPQQFSHRQKRPFQPSITSFFARSDRYDQSRPAITTQQPILEASVQSDLLSVGMRVRKAVPEGYKTHKTSLFYDPTPAMSTPFTSSTNIPRKPTELLPFCGLHRVGGHSVQPVNAEIPIDIFNDDTVPFGSSQESNISNISNDSMPAAPMLYPLATNKRRLEDEEENEDIPPFQLHFSDPLDPLLADLSMDGGPLSPLSGNAARVIAKPSTRRKGGLPKIQEEAPSNEFDFGEAAFLQPWGEGEVVMGGTQDF